MLHPCLDLTEVIMFPSKLLIAHFFTIFSGVSTYAKRNGNILFEYGNF